MAKTKKECLAKARKDLQAPPPVDPPASRHRSKRPVEPSRSSGAPSVPAAPAPPAVKVKAEPTAVESASPTAPPFEISWENIGKLMNHYNLSEKDATKLLLELIGPDVKGKSFWARYAEKIKADAQKMYAEIEADPDYWKKRRLNMTERSEEPAPASAVPEKPVAASAVPEKPMAASAVPEPVAAEGEDEGEDDVDMGGFDGEEEEEEPIDGDPLDEDDGDDNGEELLCGAKGGGNDDQDSPASGACAEPSAPEDRVCESQPDEPVEPTRMPVDKDAVVASATLKASLGAIPTPSRDKRKKPDSPDKTIDEYKSLLSLSF